MSELVFSFDDIEMDSDMNLASQSCDSISLLSPSPSSSASQSGYVTISDMDLDLDIKWECTFTELYNRDERGRTISSPPTTSSSPDNREQQRNRQESLLHLNAPQESAHSPTPESTTPRTKKFQDSMLSLLSLLPPERYLSPSPSIKEGRFEEAETRQYDFVLQRTARYLLPLVYYQSLMRIEITAIAESLLAVKSDGGYNL
ncbi:hypothetical protein E0Z10_g1245 [Xylaria hypoxylon]|uniref:Uncharacterized protein n=1 Tax=Xylaria hypoxylon TaxID=37992 RepID=A0A4Z0Z7L0_9PEZI|nr:hypothetical protein E0Z10_g1245 [Xylaria hypoxylon]